MRMYICLHYTNMTTHPGFETKRSHQKSKTGVRVVKKRTFKKHLKQGINQVEILDATGQGFFAKLILASNPSPIRQLPRIFLF